ncbi:hypothetical protein PVAND_010411 [Polypedilum vanderplanki]|uniref:Choline/ethanolamine kinase n=1 Tax=Polypedilum vanderplanki TaxID=319348 RepID=A0A9J6CGC0_POLVA|nr:hypothetical protein PVAND_010411 [Polypedilum vanderplanki]
MQSLIKATRSNSDMRDVATRICREYLSGAWKTISQDEIQVKRMSGGLSNFLYYVSLPNRNDFGENTNLSKRTRKDSYHSSMEPTKVLLRIYGQSHGEHALETMLTESVVFALLSERQLGPKLHGIFPGGRIEQYIPARSLTTAELSDSKISAKIAEKMGQIHSLHIPVSKEADWIFNTINRWLNNVDAIMNDIKNNNNDDDQVPEIQKRLSKIDLRHEANWLKKIAETESYPVVFCHNDLQEGNILFRQNNFVPPDDLVETLDEELHKIDDLSPMLISCPKTKIENVENTKVQDTINGNSRKRSLVDSSIDNEEISSNFDNDCKKDDPELMIIDFEYCAYNYRGFDIANHFLEWTYDYTNEKFPFFFYRPENYPNEKQIDNFIDSYLKNINMDAFDNKMTFVEEKKQLLEEINLFTIASHLFWTIWAIVNSSQEIEFGYWEYADIRLKEYFNAKEKYLQLKPMAKEIYDMQIRRK